MTGSKLREFIEDSNGRGSAARLNMVIGVGVGSVVVMWLAASFKLSGEVFFTFMLATGGVYGVGKFRESVEKVEETRANSPNQPIAVIPAVIPSPVTINTSNANPDSQNDSNIAATGNVTVNPKPKRRGK